MLGYVLAIAIGLSLGLIGGGGSILAVPTLVYVVGVPTKEAIAMSLFIVGGVSILGRRSPLAGRQCQSANGSFVCPCGHGG